MFMAGIALLMCAVPVLAQNFEQTVTWKVKQGETKDGLTEVVFDGTIADGWHTYGIHHKASATTVEFTDISGCSLSGDLYEPLPKQTYEGDSVYFNKIKLGQKVLAGNEGGTIKGVITTSSCHEKECGMPEDWEFSVTLTAPSTGAATVSTADNAQDTGETTVAAWTEESQNAGGSIWGLILEAIL